MSFVHNPPTPNTNPTDVPLFWVLDANILFSEWARWLMVTLAEQVGATIGWTPLIQDECFRNLVRLGRLSPEDALAQQAVLLHAMNAQSLPTASEGLFADVRMVDAKDRHVAATALGVFHQQHTQVGLMTWNIRDFPKRALQRKGIVRFTPDELAVAVWRDSTQVRAGLDASVQRMQAFLALNPAQQMTTYQQRARPLPQNDEDWRDFLARNRMFAVARRRDWV